MLMMMLMLMQGLLLLEKMGSCDEMFTEPCNLYYLPKARFTNLGSSELEDLPYSNYGSVQAVEFGMMANPAII